jgi:uncharacterized membrane protein YfcA
MQILTEAVILLIAGSFVGTLSGLLGIGGGLMIVPLLTYLLIHFHQVAFDQAMLMAIGTSLAAIIFTGGVSSFFHTKRNNMSWSTAAHYIPGVFLGSLAMAFTVFPARICFSNCAWAFLSSMNRVPCSPVFL